MRKKRFLQTVEEWGARLETFDGGDLAAFDLRGGDEARADWSVVEEDGAGTAVAGVATDFRSGEAKIIA
jgi:hypothetical protein